MNENNRDKMDSTDEETIDEAIWYYINKDDGDKSEEDDGEKKKKFFPKFESLQKIDKAYSLFIYVSDPSYLPIPKRNRERTLNL